MTDVAELEKKINELKSMKNIDMPKSDAISGEEIREDVSEKVKNLVKELAKEGDYRFGVFVGNAGGKRKIIECPSCKSKMVVAGAKAPRAKSTKPMSDAQKEWLDMVKAVGELPQYEGVGRKKHMKAAAELKKKGVTLDQLKSLIQ